MNARILIADDNPRIRSLMADIVNEVGYAFDAVTNGAEAVEACRGREYRLVLMDLVMPELSGIEAARQIRTLPIPYCWPTIVALTGYPGEITPGEMLMAGIDRQLTKPESYDVIAAEIRRAMA